MPEEAELLSATEARVLGALMEKAATTPEYYPLSLNALVNACNQKSSRDPVMTLEEGEVREALHTLERRGLAHHVHDARVGKWEHTTGEKWNLRRDESALLCVLLLRGPQTPGELRTRTERLHTFEELSSVTAALERLSQRTPPMTQVLPRQPGSREARWRELVSLAGQAGQSDDSSPAPTDSAVTQTSDVHQQLAALQQELSALKERVAALESSARGTAPAE